MFVYQYAGPVFDNDDSLHSPSEANKYQLPDFDNEGLRCTWKDNRYILISWEYSQFSVSCSRSDHKNILNTVLQQPVVLCKSGY
jgi:hypothetical protein